MSVVLPSDVNPAGRAQRLAAIARTWGPAAHAVFVEHQGQRDAESWPAGIVDTCDDASFPRRLVAPMPEAEGVAPDAVLREVIKHVPETLDGEKAA